MVTLLSAASSAALLLTHEQHVYRATASVQVRVQPPPGTGLNSSSRGLPASQLAALAADRLGATALQRIDQADPSPSGQRRILARSAFDLVVAAQATSRQRASTGVQQLA